MASAQNVAGKFAARPKVVDKSSSSRKKRAFWKRGGPKVVATGDDDDGEYHAWEMFGSFYESGEDWLNYAWSIMPSLSSEKDNGSGATIQKAGGAKKNKLVKGKINHGNTIDPSWKWDLFMAESEVFLIAVGISIVLAVLSWIWYNKSSIIPPIHGTKDANAGKKVKEEEEGGKCKCIFCACPLSFPIFFNCVNVFLQFGCIVFIFIAGGSVYY